MGGQLSGGSLGAETEFGLMVILIQFAKLFCLA